MTAMMIPVDWKAWMQSLGRHRRRIREFLGLSQEQLARLAGVSQGAVSRLEAGRGLATPLLVVLKLDAAFNKIIREMEPDLLNEDVKQYFESVAQFLPNDFSPQADTSVARDSYVEELLLIFRGMPDRHRERLLAVVRATADALSSTNASVASEAERG